MLIDQGREPRDPSGRGVSVATLVHADAWAIIELAPDAVLVVDERGCIDLANRAAVEMFGYDREHLIGTEVDALVPVGRRKAHQAHRSRYVASPTTRPMGLGLDLWARHEDGSEFPVEISLSPVTLGSGQRYVAIVRDLTPHRAGRDDGSDRASALEPRAPKRGWSDPFEAEMEAALVENERANDALRHFLEAHRGHSRLVIEQILGGATPAEALQLEEVPKRRNEYQKRLRRFEASRKRLRLVLFRWALSKGSSASKIAPGLGISRQMAVRLAQEANATADAVGKG